MKPTKRKAFNFLRSYFDVLNKLDKDSDKLSFLLAIIDKQFLNTDPTNLEFIPNLCYESQRHQIEKSVNGWLRANKTDVVGNPILDPTPNPILDPEEEEVQEEEKEEYINNKEYKSKILKDSYYIEVTAMQTKSNIETVKKYLETFDNHLIRTSEQKKTLKDYKTHFTHWLNLQDIKKVVVNIPNPYPQ